MTKKILFICHETSRTGAPIVLLAFLEWLKKNSDIPFEILLVKGGPLKEMFEKIAPTTSLEDRRPEKLWMKFFLKCFRCIYDPRIQKLKRVFSDKNIGLIYSNTVTNGEILEHLMYFGCPVVCHVHEHEFGINFYTERKDFEKVKKYTQQYIACSEGVKKNLVENHGIEEKKIEVIHEFIKINTYSVEKVQQMRWKIREQLAIPKDALVVCASGTLQWRKSPDLFVQIAGIISKKKIEKPVYFLWVGGPTTGVFFAQIWHDVKKLGLEKYIKFVGEKENPYEYFASCDVFILVSREEPFGLVMLEAASLGKAIVCFDKIGGAEEFVGKGCGVPVPYLDIECMVQNVIALLNSKDLRDNFGQNGAQKVREKFCVEVQGPKILRILESLLFYNK